VVSFYGYGDEPSGSSATELVCKFRWQSVSPRGVRLYRQRDSAIIGTLENNFAALSLHMLGGTGNKLEMTQSEWLVSGQRFEPEISLKRSRSSDLSTVVLYLSKGRVNNKNCN
jgi:hypothetical protein